MCNPVLSVKKLNGIFNWVMRSGIGFFSLSYLACQLRVSVAELMVCISLEFKVGIALQNIPLVSVHEGIL